jgi:hypothetical protein
MSRGTLSKRSRILDDSIALWHVIRQIAHELTQLSIGNVSAIFPHPEKCKRRVEKETLHAYEKQ